ncbi:hypothetical protein BpsS140_00065 [Bacillus phage vB_BpsS-140]|nr:hypothetical protein BpsS140_00065 [Bacillus phage vB_BpsS-140]
MKLDHNVRLLGDILKDDGLQIDVEARDQLISDGTLPTGYRIVQSGLEIHNADRWTRGEQTTGNMISYDNIISIGLVKDL